MKRHSSGFTLLETTLAAGILVVASVTIASLFVSSVQTNLNNRDRTGAGLALSDKIEQITAAPLTDPQWTAGQYSDYVTFASDGTVITSATDSTLKYLRTWQISASQPKTLTVIVYASHSIVSGQQTELIRASINTAPRW